MTENLSIKQASDLLQSKHLSSKELIEIYLNKIKAGKELNCYNFVSEETALLDAIKSDERRASNSLKSDFDGIPIGVKDLFCTQGILTTASSKILSNFIPTYESTVTMKCKESGLISLGKLNCDEFAMGSTNKTSYFGPVKNPWRPKDSKVDLVPGGSSGGSAAAVAGDLCIASLGTDTGGSIRQPASFTGTVGLKPSYGRVSRWGIVAFASSLDQAGPITKTVDDAAIMLDIISGHDKKDSTSSIKEKENYSKNINSNVKGMKIGIPKEFMSDDLPKSTLNAWNECKDLLKSNGAEIVNISLPHTMSALPTYYIIAPAEASSNLARYDGVRYGLREQGEDLIDMYEKTRSEGFGDEVKRRILLGTFALSKGYSDDYYEKAQKIRQVIRMDFMKAYNDVDLILAPTTASPAFKIDEKIKDPVKMYYNDYYTISANLAGLPAVSIPVGFYQDMPMGFQLIGDRFREERILHVSHQYQSITDWHTKIPEPYQE